MHLNVIDSLFGAKAGNTNENDMRTLLVSMDHLLTPEKAPQRSRIEVSTSNAQLRNSYAIVALRNVALAAVRCR